jgi:hypothetical protein
MFSLSNPRRWKAARSRKIKWTYDIHSNNNVIYVYSIRDAMLEEWNAWSMEPHPIDGCSTSTWKLVHQSYMLPVFKLLTFFTTIDYGIFVFFFKILVLIYKSLNYISSLLFSDKLKYNKIYNNYF